MAISPPEFPNPTQHLLPSEGFALPVLGAVQNAALEGVLSRPGRKAGLPAVAGGDHEIRRLVTGVLGLDFPAAMDSAGRDDLLPQPGFQLELPAIRLQVADYLQARRVARIFLGERSEGERGVLLVGV